MEFSDPERALLQELQRDATTPLAELGRRVGMAQSTVWRRIQEYEAAGLVTGRVALLDPKKAAAGLCVYAEVTLDGHDEDSIGHFTAIVAAHPEIMECHAVAGTSDYMLKIRTRNVESYERFLTRVLLRSGLVRSVHSTFSLKQLKHTTVLPV